MCHNHSYLKKTDQLSHGCLSVTELPAPIRYNLHGCLPVVDSFAMVKSWLLVKISNVSKSMFTSNGVACHVKILWLVAPAKLWLFTGKSANISGCLPVTVVCHMPNYGYLLLFRKYLHGGLPVPELLVTCQNLDCLQIPKNKEQNNNIKLQAIFPWLFTSCGVAYHMGRTWLFTSKNKQYISVVVCAKIHVVYQ